MREIARQATAAWGRRGTNAITAHDLLWIDIPQQRIDESEVSKAVAASGNASLSTLIAAEMTWGNDQWDDPLEPDQSSGPIQKRKWENNQTTQRGGRPPRGYWKRGRGRGGESGSRHANTNLD